MSDFDQTNWYVIGYLRTVPGEHTFVFPVVQNAEVAVGRAYYALNGSKLEFLEPDFQDTFIRIVPLGIPETSKLQDVLPLYGYEVGSGNVWFGDACELSKALIDFACGSDHLTAGKQREISDFLERVVTKREFVAKKSVLMQGRATIVEGPQPLQYEELPGRTTVKVLGVGSGGSQVVRKMISQGVQGAQLILADTDVLNLQSTTEAVNAIHLLKADAAIQNRFDTDTELLEPSLVNIRDAIFGADMLFLIATLGGETGSGVTPLIAKIAKSLGIFTVCVVATPFEFEGGRRISIAERALIELDECCDSLIVVRDEKLLEVMGDEVTQSEAFTFVDKAIADAVGGIVEVINTPGHVNIDFEDVRYILSTGGRGFIGMGQADGPDRARAAAEKALASPLLEGISLSSAAGVLVLISAGEGSLRLSESKLAMNTIRSYASPDASIIYGTAYDNKLDFDMRVTIIASGVPQRSIQKTSERFQILRTGTDNVPFSVPTVGQSSESVSFSSVWRSNRKQASSRVDRLSPGGMDDFEIPAFLRKTVD